MGAVHHPQSKLCIARGANSAFRGEWFPHYAKCLVRLNSVGLAERGVIHHHNALVLLTLTPRLLT